MTRASFEQRLHLMVIGRVDSRNDIALNEGLEASDELLSCSLVAIGLDQHAVRALGHRKKRIRLRSHDQSPRSRKVLVRLGRGRANDRCR